MDFGGFSAPKLPKVSSNTFAGGRAKTRVREPADWGHMRLKVGAHLRI